MVVHGMNDRNRRSSIREDESATIFTMEKKSRFLHGQRIEPPPIDGNISIVDLIDKTFNAYNAARLREACHLFTERMLAGDVTVGMSLSGAMTPAGLGMAAIIPLMRAGFVDWIVSTGATD